LNKGRNEEGIEPREAFPDTGERLAEGGPGSEERECQKLISAVAVGAAESVSRNQLIKCELLKNQWRDVMTPMTGSPFSVDVI